MSCLVGDQGRHLIPGSVDPRESKTQTASRSVHPRLQGSRLSTTDTHKRKHARDDRRRVDDASTNRAHAFNQRHISSEYL